MFFDWLGKHFSINAFLVHSCKLSLVYYSFIIQEKRRRVLQSCFLARNLKHSPTICEWQGRASTVLGSVREFINQPNVYGGYIPQSNGFSSLQGILCFLATLKAHQEKTDVKRFSSSTHIYHAENMMWSYIPVEQMKSSSCTSPPSIYEEPLTLHQYGCTCYWKMAKSIAFFIGLKLITVDKQSR